MSGLPERPLSPMWTPHHPKHETVLENYDLHSTWQEGRTARGWIK